MMGHRGKMLTYQQVFVDAVEHDPLGTVRVLVAPPGTGKTRTILELILRWTNRDAKARVLVVTDGAALAEHYVDALSMTPVPTTFLPSRRNWRQWQLAHPDVERTGFEHVVVTTVHLVQDERVLQVLHTTPWDLVVVDGTHGLRREDGLLASVRNANSSVKIVLTDRPTTSEFWNTLLKEARVTQWVVQPTRSSTVWRELRYVPSDSEAQFREALTQLLIVPLRAGGFDREATFVESLTQSSVYAIETLLHQLRPFRNRFVHGPSGAAPLAAQEAMTALRQSAREEGFDLGNLPGESLGTALEFATWGAALANVGAFDKLLDEITQDAKLAALIDLILNDTAVPTLVVTSFEATARYLRSALREYIGTVGDHEEGPPSRTVVISQHDEAGPGDIPFERAVYYDILSPSGAPLRLLGFDRTWEQWVLVAPWNRDRLIFPATGSRVEVVES